MPDHLHGLIEAPADESLEDFCKALQASFGLSHKASGKQAVWQVSYYDRILPEGRCLVDVAAYIWDNPVKRGLAADSWEYPWSGPRHAITQA
jgi:REP element-mobilizing transposase RayT